VKAVTILGARPQFVKSAPVTKVLGDAGIHQIILHTGQHYDHDMSQVFFDELGIPAPEINLGVGSGSHCYQIAEMLRGIEKCLIDEQPDCVLVYGDTNSTLAGALAASKMRIRLAHIEAGLRSFNREMPEEHNRVLTDHCADVLFCPTQTAVENLKHENIAAGVHLVGDTMYDAVLQFAERAAGRSSILQQLRVQPKQYILATVHRPYNADSEENLTSIIGAFGELADNVVFPIHPRTRKKVEQLSLPRNVIVIDPVGYLDMLRLEQNARLILTDSGGIQKEAYFFGVPCLTLRPETEWVETVQEGWNVLTGADRARIVQEAGRRCWSAGKARGLFGDGHAGEKIVRLLLAECG
jgi:UDP-N-acetylglucosamine 2-epimerase